MMKKKLLFILSLTFIGISCFACLDDETKYVTQKKTNYPLTAFAVAVNNVHHCLLSKAEQALCAK